MIIPLQGLNKIIITTLLKEEKTQPLINGEINVTTLNRIYRKESIEKQSVGV